jgi:Ras-related GTP-binding protein C/D
METAERRSSAPPHLLVPESHFAQEEPSSADPSRLKPGAQLTLMRYLQDLPDAEVPHTDPVPPRFHTGRLAMENHACCSWASEGTSCLFFV